MVAPGMAAKPREFVHQPVATCRCGKPIRNAPEHLVGLVGFVCEECARPRGASSDDLRAGFESLRQAKARTVVPGRQPSRDRNAEVAG